ncbi:MAG: hypothetical protein WA001_00185 [Patescibacteria group bacterium]
MALQLPIEKDEKLLQGYGRAIALSTAAEYLLGEFVRLDGGLFQANQEIVNKLLDKKTFGVVADLADLLIEDKKIVAEINKVVKERNLLAHAISVQSIDGELSLLGGKTGNKPLTVEYLSQVAEDARNVIHQIIKLIQKKHKLV